MCGEVCSRMPARRARKEELLRSEALWTGLSTCLDAVTPVGRQRDPVPSSRRKGQGFQTPRETEQAPVALLA